MAELLVNNGMKIRARSLTLDVAKGVLVLVMLVHHAWSAVYLPGNNDAMRGVVSFVSSAFILYSGYLLGMYLFSGYLSDCRQRSLRDIWRGVRLLAMFMVFNLLLYFAGYAGISGRTELFPWLIECIGPNPPDAAVFSLLSAFAWFFFGSAILFFVVVYSFSGSGEAIIRRILLFSSAVIFVLLYLKFGLSGPGLFATATIYGCIGIFFGMLLQNRVVQHIAAMRKAGWIAVGFYLLLSALVFSGNFKPYQWYPLFVCIASVAVWRLSDFVVVMRNRMAVFLAYMGSYTLIAYLIQVIVSKTIDMKQVMFYSLGGGQWGAFLLALLCMGLMMLVGIAALHILRRFGWIDRGYRVVFG